MPEERFDEKTMTVGEDVEKTAYAEQEESEVVANAEEEREPKAEFEKFKQLRPGFQLCYDERDIENFGFVGAVYVGAVQSGLNYVHNNVVWLTKTRPEERRELMAKMAAQMDAAREAAAMPPERQETQDASPRGKMTMQQGAEANKAIQTQTENLANDVRQLHTKSEAVSQEQRGYTQEKNKANARTAGKTTRKERREAKAAARQARREGGRA